MKLKEYYKEKNYIHYSNCHEDFGLLYKYVKDDAKRILSVASGLDNSLGFLAKDGVKVYAFDYNPSQVFLGKLKIEAIKKFDHEDYLCFLGIKGDEGAYRLKLYETIKNSLDVNARNYFDQHLFLIEIGLADCGRFEQYFHLFREKVFPFVCAEKSIRQFATADTLEEQKKIYDKKINTVRFKLMFKIFFSNTMMAKLGRDKEFFKYSKDNLPKILKKRVDTGFYNCLNKTNPYYGYVLNGGYNALPFYMQEANYYKIKKNINNIFVEQKSFDQMLDKSYDFMNLSDIFEYMDESYMPHYSKIIMENLNQGGRVAFWNMMNIRQLPKCNRINGINDYIEDRAFFYRDYLVYEK